MNQTTTNLVSETKPLLQLTTYGIYHGVACCRIEISILDKWVPWGLQNEIATSWYLFNLICLLGLGNDKINIKGTDKLQEWRLSLQVLKENV